MANEKKEARKQYQKEQQKRVTSKRIDGRHLHLTCTGDAIGLVQAESESEEENPASPSPAPQIISFANILDDIRTETNNTDATQPADEKHVMSTATGDRVVRRLQLLNQPVTAGLPVNTEVELAHLEEGIEGARTSSRIRTGVALCEDQHVILMCLWSLDDPVNRNGTWRLHQDDYRETSFFSNGVDDHKRCGRLSTGKFLEKFGKRMIADFESNIDFQWDNRDLNKVEKDRRSMAEKRRSPDLHQVTRALGPLVVCAMRGKIKQGKPDGTGDKRDQGKRQGEDQKDTEKKSNAGDASKKGDRGDKPKKSKQEIAQAREDAKRKADKTRLKMIIDDKRDRREADKQRIERAAGAHVENQTMTNGATSIQNFFATLKKSKAERRHQDSSDMTELEQRELRGIRAAQQEEASQLDQAEAQEDRQQELSAQPQEGEDGDDKFLAAVEEALENASAEPEPAKKSATDTRKKTSRSKLSRVELALDSPNDAETSANAQPKRDPPRKKRFKQRLRHVVQDWSDDSDSVKAPQPSESPKSRTKAAIESSKTTKPFAEMLLERASGKSEEKTDQSVPKEKAKAPKKSATSSKTSEESITRQTLKAKKKEGKAYKSTKFISDSDLENNDKNDVELPTDKLKAEKVNVEITSTEETSVTTEQDGIASERISEHTMVAVETRQEDGTAERIEITETTAVSSNSSKSGKKVSVQHATHVAQATTLELPSQEGARDCPPSSPAHELQECFNTPTNASGTKFFVDSPDVAHGSPSSPGADSVASFSSMKRKRETTADDQQPEPDITASSKKRKVTPPSLPAREEGAALQSPIAPRTTPNTPSSPLPAPFFDSSSTPGAASITSSTSSTSSEKRKTTWSEEDGEVTIRPDVTKRVKKVQSKTEVREATATETEYMMEKLQEAEWEGTTERAGATKGEREDEAGAISLEPVSFGTRDEDEDEFDSLFGPTPTGSEQGEEDADSASQDATEA